MAGIGFLRKRVIELEKENKALKAKLAGVEPFNKKSSFPDSFNKKDAKKRAKKSKE